MSIRLLSKRIAIHPLADPETTPSGRIIIPAIAKERVDQGVVKYVADDVEEVKVGDYVIFSGYSGQNVFIGSDGSDESESLIIMHEDAVIAIINVPDEVTNLYLKSPVNLSVLYDTILNIIPVATRVQVIELAKLVVDNEFYNKATIIQAVEAIGFYLRDVPNQVRLKDRTSKPDSTIKAHI